MIHCKQIKKKVRRITELSFFDGLETNFSRVLRQDIRFPTFTTVSVTWYISFCTIKFTGFRRKKFHPYWIFKFKLFNTSHSRLVMALVRSTRIENCSKIPISTGKPFYIEIYIRLYVSWICVWILGPYPSLTSLSCYRIMSTSRASGPCKLLSITRCQVTVSPLDTFSRYDFWLTRCVNFYPGKIRYI